VNEKLWRYRAGDLHRIFDLKMAIAGALFLGTIVFGLNLRHSLLGAATAALKQGTYTFLFGGLVTRMCKSLAVRGRRRTPALLQAVFVPATLAIAATLAVHSLKGTPQPLISTLPTAILSPPAFLTLGLRERRRMLPSGD